MERRESEFGDVDGWFHGKGNVIMFGLWEHMGSKACLLAARKCVSVMLGHANDGCEVEDIEVLQ